MRQHRRGPLTASPSPSRTTSALGDSKPPPARRSCRGIARLTTPPLLLDLRAAGAVIVGKTNLDEFAMGSSTENSAFGPTRNPWNPIGSRAAARAVRPPRSQSGRRWALSVPIPAARSVSRLLLCGVVGFKPTYGLVSRFGLIAFSSSLDQIGPLGPIGRGCLDVCSRRWPGTIPLMRLRIRVRSPTAAPNLDRGVKGVRVGCGEGTAGGGL